MPSQFDVIRREITFHGACYLVCRAFDPSDFFEALAYLTDSAFQRGAERVYVCCRDRTVLPRDGFCAGDWRFAWDGDFYLLYKNIPAVPAPAAAPLSVKPLRAGNAALYRDLYNEAFFPVPGARTMDEAETDAMLADGTRTCGFLMEGGLPVGVYALSYAEQTPEIAAVAISPALQRQGYGRRALATLEGMLQKSGHKRVQLLTSTQNEPALRLYRSAGYGEDALHSTWYRAGAK